jgi:pimeloyl-ACP methyl ester carboxylesterase
MVSHTLNIFDTIIEVREYGSDKKPTLLAIHGWGNTLERADAFLEALSRHFHVYTLSLPGYGHSFPDPRAQKLSFMVSLIDPICEQLKIQPHLLGYSLGTIILTQYLAENPRFNKKVVYIGAPMARTPKPFLLYASSIEIVRQVVREVPFLRNAVMKLGRDAVQRLSLNKKRKLWKTKNREVTSEGLFDTLLTALNTFPDPRTLPQMIAYIYGKDDLLIPKENQPTNLTIIPGAGHLIVFEQPVLLAQTVRNVLNEPLWPCAPEMS